MVDVFRFVIMFDTNCPVLDNHLLVSIELIIPLVSGLKALNPREAYVLLRGVFLSAVKVAQSFIDQWIAVFNARDTDGRLQLLHFPHLRIMPSGQIRIEDESMAEQLFLIGRQMQVDEGWDHSVVDDVQVIQYSDRKIHLTNRFTRYKTDGRKYLTGEALWILVKDGDRWKRCFVSNIDIQRFDISADEFQQMMANREQLLREE
jgi:hypothetical protein